MVVIKKRYKAYLRLNIVSIIFIATSFIFTTLAWFAYSGMSNVSAEMEVKAWYIELTKKGEKVSNEIVISSDDIYPGMETINEVINIKNSGDSNAYVEYKIESARILDIDNYEVDDENLLSATVEDKLSHYYPFHININLEKQYLKAKEDGNITVSVSWPLESGKDELDSEWGNNAYNFQNNENKKYDNDKNYKKRTSIQIVLKITAEQYINKHEETILNFGDTILYDPVKNIRCYEVGNGCIETTLIEDNIDNLEQVRLLPKMINDYSKVLYQGYETEFNNITLGWQVLSRGLVIEDLIEIISRDINESYIVGNELSNVIIGTINNEDRLKSIINETQTSNRHYQFSKKSFEFLSSDKCYWTNSKLDNNYVYSLKKIDENISEIYLNNYQITDENNKCSVMPVILIDKGKLNYTLYE